MRPLEIALFVPLFLLLIPFPKTFQRKSTFVFSGLADLILVAHWLLEGYRWQMVPAFALTIILVAGRFLGLAKARPEWVTVVGRGVGALAVAVAALPPVLFPVPRLPEPGGPYQIGTLTYQWTDPARVEQYNPDPESPEAPRSIMVQIWYPALPAADAEPAPWLDRLDVAGPLIAGFFRLPPFFLDHATLVKTHGYAAAPPDPSGGRYPVLVYSHGWNGFRSANLNQSEALASRGYIVAAVDHTYGAMFTVFEDGQLAPNNRAILPAGPEDANYYRAAFQLEQTYAADLSFVLDQLALLDAGEIDGPLQGQLDLDRAGFFGHSTGGGAVVVACQQDERCQAGLAMDAWLEPLTDEALSTPLQQPFLFMRSENWASAENDARLARVVDGLEGPGYRMTILGTRHYDFTLLPLLTPLAAALGLKGPLEGSRTLAVISDYLVAFFDQHLKGLPQPLLDGPSDDHPEVEFERRKREIGD